MSCRKPENGAALVIVLSIVVLLTALVLAFMTFTKNELSATMQYSIGQEVHALSETATNLVMAQIREATLSGINNSGRGTHAWASQPGALRVWDSNGDLVQLYKLYSSGRMKEDGLGFLANEIPDNWRDQPDIWVDLNEPVAKGSGGSQRWHYPVLSPEALGVVEGFSSGQVDDPSIAWDTRTSMPVRWLYISRTGEINNTLQPDSVGRIAFWTDDETCKVNINTASFTRLINRAVVGQNQDDSYWDVPSTRMAQDFTMGRSMPIQDEFQRYPGHPAFVNLGSILKLDNNFTQQNAFNLLPRYKWGGSRNGTRTWLFARDAVNPEEERIGGPYRKMDRLYASVDELHFDMERNVQRDFPAVSGVDQAELTKLYGFFLTASSRAPDLNLFGQPRVLLWPLHRERGADYRTVYDNLIARCGTVGPMDTGYIYYFQRYDPLSQTNDWLEIPRNQELFSYLRTMTSQAIPGFGGATSLAAKYNNLAAGEWDQILTEIFDYIRCVNLNETYSGRGDSFNHYTPELRDNNDDQQDRWLGGWVTTNADRLAGAGFVLPIRIDSLGTRGMGRVPTISEVGFALFANPGAAHADRIISFLLVEPSTPVMGFMPWLPPLNFSMRVTGASGNPALVYEPDGIRQPLFPGMESGVQHITRFRNPYQSTGSQGGTTVGGTVWPSWFFPNAGSIYHNSLRTGASDENYPFFFPISSSSEQFPGVTVRLEGGVLRIEYGIDGVPYQTFEVELPSTTLPKPEQGGTSRPLFNSSVGGLRWLPDFDVVKSTLLRDGDVRVIACLQDVPKEFFEAHPDYHDETNKMAHSFTTRTQYAYRGATFGSLIHSPDDPSSPLEYRKSNANLDAGFHETNFHPDIRPDIIDLRQNGWAGDWSTGVGTLRDGAHTMKSDEGFARGTGAPSPNYFLDHYWSSGFGFFSPTRQIPSAGLFGTLPTGVKQTLNAYTSGSPGAAAPWRTLVFCPNPDAEESHIGLADTPDRLLLDFFHMPVVEPYAISEPLSTAGRINMNSQILPFTDIVRESGLHAVLSSQKVTALSPNLVSAYKTAENTTIYRFRLNVEETLKQFRERFSPGGNPAAGDIFRSAAEICSIFLIPNTYNELVGAGVTGPTLDEAQIEWTGTTLRVPEMTQWWRNYRLTGDNLRERPYAQIYPLLTTKSNTYTVHMIAQTLAPGTNRVTGEYRGSTMIERYIDPADARIGPEFNPDTDSLEPLYRFRVVDTKRFAP